MIIVDVPYGGRSQPRSLHIIRVPENEGDDVWVIDPNSVEAMQDWRTISREQAGFLKQPEKIRLAGHAAASKLRSGGWLFPLVAGVFLGFVLSAVFSRIRRPISVVPPEQ
ncbi:MAG: hypothetical protein JSS49_23450 [Planctomycetes bacterium]|nr:hypothetical protein [Planctomycetota bacterium]